MSSHPTPAAGVATTAPDLLSGLLAAAVDDAAAPAPAGRVVASHLRHRGAWYAPFVGSLRLTDQDLPGLTGQLDADPVPSPLPVALVVIGGAGAVEPALAWATRHPGLQLRSLHTCLRDEDDLPRNASRLVTALGGQLPDGVAVHVEVPFTAGQRPGPGWAGALDVVAGAGHRLDVRTSGSWQHDHPGSSALVVVLDAALDRELPVACTGIDRALGSKQPVTGYWEHGLLGVLAALSALLDGAAADEAAALLDAVVGDPAAPSQACRSALQRVADADPGRLRRSWTGTSSADVECLARDLGTLGLIGSRTPR